MRSISFFVSLELYLIIRSTSFGRMMCQLQGGRMKNEAALKPKAKLLIFVMMPMPDTLLLDVNGMKIELCYYKILYNRCCLAPQPVAQFSLLGTLKSICYLIAYIEYDVVAYFSSDKHCLDKHCLYLSNANKLSLC